MSELQKILQAVSVQLNRLAALGFDVRVFNAGSGVLISLDGIRVERRRGGGLALYRRGEAGQ